MKSALFTLSAIGLHLLLRFGVGTAAEVAGHRVDQLPLFAVLIFGGGPLVAGLLIKLVRLEFGSDLRAGISIVTSLLLGEWLAGGPGRAHGIALQSAVGGTALSLIGMVIAALGYLPPVAGAMAQEVIDVAAVLNALRVALPPKALSDYETRR